MQNTEKTKTSNNKKRSGFALIALAILLVIIGLFLEISNKTAPEITTPKVQGAKDSLIEIKRALEEFKISNGYYPCPASRILPATDNNFGKKTVCDNGATCDDADGLADGIVCDVNVAIGAIPTRELQLPDDMGIDKWGNKIGYAVDVTNAKGITVDGNPYKYFVYSAGKNGKGAYNRNGILVTACGAGAGTDAENCDDNATFTAEKWKLEADAKSFANDDLGDKLTPKVTCPPVTPACPGGLLDCSLWLDAGAPSLLQADGTNANNPGDLIEVWCDKSPRTNHASRVGKPNFNGNVATTSSNYMFADIGDVGNAFTVITTYLMPNSLVAGNNSIISGSKSKLFDIRNSNGNLCAGVDGSYTNCNANTLSGSEYYITTSVFNGATTSLYQNGAVVANAEITAPPNLTSNNIALIGGEFGGSVYSVAVLPNVLTDDDRKAAECNMAHNSYFGICSYLPAGHCCDSNTANGTTFCVGSSAGDICSVCGDSNITGVEQCDDGNTSDGDDCNSDCTNSTCGDSHIGNGESCDDGNGVSGDGCSSCIIECGNLSVDGGEQCDDGNTNNGDGCDSSCQNEVVDVCGDSSITGAEQCDDGNINNGDGCDSSCQNEVVDVCGDSSITGAEQCDDGNINNGDGCDSSCQAEVVCGDGNANGGEQCDDGNINNGDGCDSSCIIEDVCGDSSVTGAEQCDDGNTSNGDGCDSSCQTEIVDVCGDSSVTGAEQCDDGNTSNGDGCDSSCQTEIVDVCGDSSVTGAEQCDDGNNIGGDGCDSSCQNEVAPVCGNSSVESGEQCDDGNVGGGDGCDSSCQTEASSCGNGITESWGGEQCDDNSITSGDGCDSSCQTEYCGDGIVNNSASELCDDGNVDNGDGCDSSCQIE